MKHDKDTTELKRKIATDPDFINSKKYGYSLTKYMAKHPKPTPDNIIAVLLCMSVNDVNEVFQDSVSKLRSSFDVCDIK